MPRRSRFPGFLWVKRDRLIQEHRIDPYQARYYGEFPYDPDAYVRARILALIEYAYRLQAK